MDKISIIVPCYNEEQSISTMVHALNEIRSAMNNIEFEYIFIDDGSSDETLKFIQQYYYIKYISFSRNFGKEAAIYAGLQNATGDFITTIDVDGQDPLYLLPEMYRILKEEDYDYVAVCRTTRKENSKLKSLGAKFFYKNFSFAQENERDMKLMKRYVLDAILKYNEYNRFFRGISNHIGFKKATLYYEDVNRNQGVSKFSLSKILDYGMNAFTNFSEKIWFIPFFIMLIGLCCSLISIWYNLIIFIIFLCFSGLFGILSLTIYYLTRIYLEVKNRPHYIVKSSRL